MKFWQLTGLAVCIGAIPAGAGAGEAAHAHGLRDGREAVTLLPAERDMILDEMRRFLSGVQAMTDAAARQDMQAFAGAARGMGRAMVHEVPPDLRARLPAGFRQLGASVHQDFDRIADDAAIHRDVSVGLSQMAATLNKCVACHAVYRLDAAPDAAGHTH